MLRARISADEELPLLKHSRYQYSALAGVECLFLKDTRVKSSKADAGAVWFTPQPSPIPLSHIIRKKPHGWKQKLGSLKYHTAEKVQESVWKTISLRRKIRKRQKRWLRHWSNAFFPLSASLCGGPWQRCSSSSPPRLRSGEWKDEISSSADDLTLDWICWMWQCVFKRLRRHVVGPPGWQRQKTPGS